MIPRKLPVCGWEQRRFQGHRARLLVADAHNPSLSRPSALHPVPGLSSRVLAEPLVCWAGCPAASAVDIDTAVPSIPTYGAGGARWKRFMRLAIPTYGAGASHRRRATGPRWYERSVFRTCSSVRTATAGA